MEKNNLRKLTVTAIFISISLVVSLINPMLRIVGGAGLRISFSSYLAVVPSLLFGPLYGGMSMGILDVLAFLVKPEGGYLFPLTLTAILGGVLRGFGIKLYKPRKKFKVLIPFFIGIVTVFGLVNLLLLKSDCTYSNFLRSFDKKTVFFTYYPILCGIVGTVLYYINLRLGKKTGDDKAFEAIFVVLLFANIIVTTINTYLLMLLIPSLSQLSFMVFYIPRLLEEIVSTIIQAYVVTLIMTLTKKHGLQ